MISRMISTFRRTGIGSVAVLLALVLVAPVARADDAPVPVTTIITSPRPQTQLMALVLSMQSLNKGADVQVLLCDAGGDLALAEPPASATDPLQPRGMSPQQLLQKIQASGAAVAVCPLYLPNSGHAQSDLLPGVQIAKPPVIAGRLLRPGAVNLTY